MLEGIYISHVGRPALDDKFILPGEEYSVSFDQGLNKFFVKSKINSFYIDQVSLEELIQKAGLAKI